MFPFYLDAPALPTMQWLPIALAAIAVFFVQTLLSGARN
jgi:hypothetical protein